MRRVLPCVMLALLTVWVVTCLAQPPDGAIPARILRWVDGDTVDVRLEHEAPGVEVRERIRILGIAAPELGEPFADDATRYLRSLTMGKTVFVEITPFQLRDLHRRLLAHMWVETEDGWSLISEAIVRAGLARILVLYPEQEAYYCRLLRARALAQVAKLGLWGAFPEPLAVGEMEARPVHYVTEVVTVVFTVSRVGSDRWGLSLWAEGSRFRFRAILDSRLCPACWEGAEFPTEALVGAIASVTGELLWDSFGGGPRIEVLFPDQLVLKTEEVDEP